MMTEAHVTAVQLASWQKFKLLRNRQMRRPARDTLKDLAQQR